ncbi:MAG: sulfotransferase [Rhizomicrobium sp.]
MRRSAQMGDPMKTDLHFALAKAYDDLGRTGDAFRHLRDGNALKRRSVAYDENTTFEDWHRIKMIFSAEFLRDRCRSEVSAQSPVFVVGMPRSGSTLVEQMLASHPDVFGAGEVSYLEDSIGTLCDGDVRFPGIVQTMSRTDLTTFGDRYVELLQSRAPFATRVTDKMLGNFRFLGLIYLALPHARIIHVQRNPVDTCFSCFAKLFSGDIPFSYDLSELGRYYRAYESLMAHWRHALPETAMLEVRYENLVADFEKEARRIVSYCGLGWDPRCLAFHATRRAVRTASAEQVRRPLYSDAVGRAEVYGSRSRSASQSAKRRSPVRCTASTGLSCHRGLQKIKWPPA